MTHSGFRDRRLCLPGVIHRALVAGSPRAEAAPAQTDEPLARPTHWITGTMIVELRPGGAVYGEKACCTINVVRRDDGSADLRIFAPWAPDEPAMATIPLPGATAGAMWDALAEVAG
jgi:hypothetical protein